MSGTESEPCYRFCYRTRWHGLVRRGTKNVSGPRKARQSATFQDCSGQAGTAAIEFQDRCRKPHGHQPRPIAPRAGWELMTFLSGGQEGSLSRYRHPSSTSKGDRRRSASPPDLFVTPLAAPRHHPSLPVPHRHGGITAIVNWP
jgi:hypothetical protein